MQIYHKGKLELNEDKCHFMCTRVPYFGEIISRHSVQLDPHKWHVLTNMPPPTNRKSTSILSKDYKIFRKVLLSYSKSVQAFVETDINKDRLDMEQHLPKAIWKSDCHHKDDVCMRFYNKKRTTVLESNPSDVRLGARLLQTMDGLWLQWDIGHDNTALQPIVFVPPPAQKQDTAT